MTVSTSVVITEPSPSQLPPPHPTTDPTLRTLTHVPHHPDMSPSPRNALLVWDKHISYQLFRRYSSPRLPHLILELSGHGVPWLIIPLLIFLFKSHLSVTAAALLLNFLAVTVLDLVVIGLLKPLLRRSRPSYNNGIAPVTIHAVDQFSFPSGHATRAGFLFSFVYFVRAHHDIQFHPIFHNSLFVTLVFVWALALCFSRVALGRHHVLDVVCGAALGASYVFVWVPFWFSDSFAVSLRHSIRDLIFNLVRFYHMDASISSKL